MMMAPGAPVATPSSTPERISGASASERGVVMPDWPGLRRASSRSRTSRSIGSPAGTPSTTQPSAAPWDSPNVVTRNRVPKVLELILKSLSIRGR